MIHAGLSQTNRCPTAPWRRDARLYLHIVLAAWDLAGRRFEVVAASPTVRRIAECARYFELVGIPSPRVHNTTAQWC